MVIVKSEFTLALNQVATERGISVDDVIASMQSAILAAYFKEHGESVIDEERDISVKIDTNTGETHIIENEQDITPPGFGRIAAQTARQVIIQKIREVEKKTVISYYQDQVGTLVRGRIIRQDINNIYVDIGKTEAILPRDEQIRSERLSINERYIFLLKEIATNSAGYSRIILSRADEQLIVMLFTREVPEIANGTVEIKRVSREPGERAKIAVFSSQSGVDPVGACVGQKGVRVQTVTDELNGFEKIDIIQWNEDPKAFLISALSPADVMSVDLDEERKKAKVTVEESQAPLAIGKNGANVNLAAKLTGYEIDIIQIKDKKNSSKELKPQEETEEKTIQPAEEPESAEDTKNNTKELQEETDSKPVSSESPEEEKEDKKA